MNRILFKRHLPQNSCAYSKYICLKATKHKRRVLLSSILNIKSFLPTGSVRQEIERILATILGFQMAIVLRKLVPITSWRSSLGHGFGAPYFVNGIATSVMKLKYLTSSLEKKGCVNNGSRTVPDSSNCIFLLDYLFVY